MQSSIRPRLRPVDAQPAQYEGMDYLHLRDPLKLSEHNVLVPEPMLPVLSLCDGNRTLLGIQTALALRFRFKITMARLEEFFSALDEACLLDNETSSAARSNALAAYRTGKGRSPALAGLSYPADPHELARLFEEYLTAAGAGQDASSNTTFRGLLSPHIDYERGWQVYAKVWSAATRSVQQADLAIVIGTDHFSEGFPLSFSSQSYNTPFGSLPLPQHLLDRLTNILGPDLAFAGELHHRSEHSVELAATWLHYLRRDHPIPMLPILAGPLETLAGPAAPLSESTLLNQIIAEIRAVTKRQRVLVVAAGDLAHIGPAFGGSPIDSAALRQVKADDDRLLDCVAAGSVENFYAANEDCAENNVCGVAPLYLTLRILGDTQGQLLGYKACPADQTETSFVTIAGAGLV